jgi:DnaK suppressor protein
MTEGATAPDAGGHLSPEEIGEFQAQLEGELRRLVRSMEVTEEASRPVELDQQAVGRLSRMDSLQNQHLTQNLRERERVRASSLIAALQRIEKGTYGICGTCEAQIPKGRLFVMPEAEECSKCVG